MNDKFDIYIDPSRDLVRIDLKGFFSIEDVQQFAADLRDKSRALTCGPNRHLTLCDVRSMNIQSQGAVGAFSQIVGSAEFRSRRLAFVTGSTLARMQAERLKTRDGVEYFDDVATAETWLLAPGNAIGATAALSSEGPYRASNVKAPTASRRSL